MRLMALQESFLAYLHEPAETLSGREHAIADDVVDSTHSSRATSSLARLGIYHHAYRARLLEVMQDVFERTWAYLGDDAFAAAAEAYIEAAPSSGRTLNRFGESFPAWLASRFPEDGDIAEVAMIDWLMRVAFDAADAAPVTAAVFATLATLTPGQWADVKFQFHPSLQIAPMAYNAASIWGALERETAPPASERLPMPATVLVWRRDTRPHFITVDGVEGEAISRLRSGESFGEMCDALSQNAVGVDVAQWLGGWLRRWLDEEMVANVKVPD